MSFNIDEAIRRHYEFRVNVVVNEIDEVMESIGELAYSNNKSLAEFLQNYDEVDVDDCKGTLAVSWGLVVSLKIKSSWT